MANKCAKRSGKIRVCRRVQEVLDIRAEYRADVTLLAGGQSLMPLLNMRRTHPRVLLDINPATDMAFIRFDGGHLTIGAGTRLRDLEYAPDVLRAVPLLSMALPYIGNPAVWSRSTVGGTLAFADLSAELSACLVNLGAEVELASVRGRRILPISNFLIDAHRTALESDEVVAAIRLCACAANDVFCFREFSPRFAARAVCGVVAGAVKSERRLSAFRLTVFGLTARATEVPATAQLLCERAGHISLDEVSHILSREALAIAPSAHKLGLRFHWTAVLAKRVYDELAS